jgi:hypothetical protein
MRKRSDCNHFWSEEHHGVVCVYCGETRSEVQHHDHKRTISGPTVYHENMQLKKQDDGSHRSVFLGCGECMDVLV